MLLGGIPDQWGQKIELTDAAVTVTRTGPDAIGFTAQAHYFLVLFTSQPYRWLALNSDCGSCALAPMGSVEVMPQHHEVRARWVVAKQTLLVGVSDTKLRRLSGLEFGDDEIKWHPPKLGVVDQRALTIAQEIRREIDSDHVAKAGCLDSWVTLFAVHMLRKYSSFSGRLAPAHLGGLAPRTRERIRDYIRSSLDKPISLEDLAGISGLSPSHLSRAFRQTFKLPPHQYIISLRLEKARLLAIQSKLPFVEVARLTGFSTNSHMTAAMRRAWGQTPSDIRRNGG